MVTAQFVTREVRVMASVDVLSTDLRASGSLHSYSTGFYEDLFTGYGWIRVELDEDLATVLFRDSQGGEYFGVS